MHNTHHISIYTYSKVTDARILDEYLYNVALTLTDPELEAQFNSVSGPKPEVMLRICGQCHIQEPTLGEYKICAGCKNIYYCTRDCQKLHWNEHKPNCVKKTKK